MWQLYFWLLSKFVDFLQKLLHQARKKFLFFPLFVHFEVTWSRYNALFKTLVPLKALLHLLLSFCFLVVSLFLNENKNAKLAMVNLKSAWIPWKSEFSTSNRDWMPFLFKLIYFKTFNARDIISFVLLSHDTSLSLRITGNIKKELCRQWSMQVSVSPIFDRPNCSSVIQEWRKGTLHHKDSEVLVLSIGRELRGSLAWSRICKLLLFELTKTCGLYIIPATSCVMFWCHGCHKLLGINLLQSLWLSLWTTLILRLSVE